MTRTLLVTNDFPPRPGGIQAFVHNLAVRQPPASLVVYTSTWPGAADFDAQQPFEVVRADTRMLLPTPAARRAVVRLARERGCESVWFGAMAPLAALAPALRDAGVQRVVAQTHGHEAAWAGVPGSRDLLRRIGSHVDVVTYLGEYTRSRLAAALRDTCRLERLAPGVDVEPLPPGAANHPGSRDPRSGSASPTDRSSCACPGWCHARGRTP